MSKTRVTPWQDKDPVPADLLRAMQARRPERSPHNFPKA